MNFFINIYRLLQLEISCVKAVGRIESQKVVSQDMKMQNMTDLIMAK